MRFGRRFGEGARHRALRARFSSAGWLAFVAVLAGGCDTKSAEKCEQALNATRQSLTVEDFDLASKWRDYAWKQCEAGPSLSELDQAIVNKQAEVKEREIKQEAQAKQNQQFVELFTNFVAQHKADPASASQNFQCGQPDEKPRPGDKNHWCVANRPVTGASSFEVRYFEAEPAAARFTATPPKAVTCDQLGPNRVIKSWQVPAVDGRQATRTHCEITSGASSGMQAVVTAADEAVVFLFTAKALEMDPALQKLVSGS